MIEPGFVNTTMYDKGEKEDLSEFKPTEYWDAVQSFQKFIVAEGRKGFSPERLGAAVYLALSIAKLAEGTLRCHQANVSRTGPYSRASSCENARRRDRKATRIRKAVATSNS